MSTAIQILPASERDLATAWANPGHAALRLEDGSLLRVVFPGIPAGGRGPDFQDAILDIDGDLVRGDVELHLRASGWFAHGHHRDRAYRTVVLHAVAANDTGGSHTAHGARRIPILVMPPAGPGHPPPFTPPCALEAARGAEIAPALLRLGRRRLRARAAGVEPLVREAGPSGALFITMLTFLGRPANAGHFASIARALPLASLIERAAQSGATPPAAYRALLQGANAAQLAPHIGRPAAAPARRLDLAARIVHAFWPREPSWPFESPSGAFAAFRQGGASRSLAAELTANVALPVALAARAGTEDEILSAWEAVPAPGTYGRLRPLEGWLGGKAARPFATAAALQGALTLHSDYCARGRCGRCPLSSGAPLPSRPPPHC